MSDVSANVWMVSAVLSKELQMIKVGDFKVQMAVGVIKQDNQLVKIATPVSFTKDGKFSLAGFITFWKLSNQVGFPAPITSFEQVQREWNKFVYDGYVKGSVSFGPVENISNGKPSKEGYLALRTVECNYFKENGSNCTVYGLDPDIVKEFIDTMVDAGYWDRPEWDNIQERMNQSPVGEIGRIDVYDF